MPLSRLVKNLLRTQEILTVFMRHGFGDLLQRMGLSDYLKSAARMADKGEAARTTPQRRLRNALQELGGAFVKLGQLLSTRPDLLPMSWIEELIPLQDDVAPVEFDQIRAVLEEDLGPLDEIFTYVDTEVLAAASIAQVHRAVTKDGDDVVVKVRRPGVKATILKDLDILDALAELLEEHVEELKLYRPTEVVDEFRTALMDELEFSREANHLDLFRADFLDHPRILFPRPYWDYTTDRVITLERIEGVKVSLIDAENPHGSDPARVAHILAEAIIRQVLEFGFFHGDPHPGNLLVVDEDRVCFIDCGMVGRLTERLREDLIQLVSAGVNRDVEMMTDVLVHMNAMPEGLDRALFMRDASLFLERYYRVPLKRLRLSAIVEDFTALIRKYRIRIPSDLLLVGKAVITLEGVGRKLDPDFDAVAVAQPFVSEIMLETYSPGAVAKKVFQGTREILRLLRDFPSDLRELSRSIRDNHFRVVVEHRGLLEAFQELDKASKRISMSIVIASIVLASSIIVMASSEPRFMGVPVLGLIGFALSAALGLWLLVSIVRSGKP